MLHVEEYLSIQKIKGILWMPIADFLSEKYDAKDEKYANMKNRILDEKYDEK